MARMKGIKLSLQALKMQKITSKMNWHLFCYSTTTPPATTINCALIVTNYSVLLKAMKNCKKSVSFVFPLKIIVSKLLWCKDLFLVFGCKCYLDLVRWSYATTVMKYKLLCKRQKEGAAYCIRWARHVAPPITWNVARTTTSTKW